MRPYDKAFIDKKMIIGMVKALRKRSSIGYQIVRP